nr:hypothetical protein [Tanacetum cinerariifolium]
MSNDVADKLEENKKTQGPTLDDGTAGGDRPLFKKIRTNKLLKTNHRQCLLKRRRNVTVLSEEYAKSFVGRRLTNLESVA